ncbi:MAG: glycosyltransferase [Rhodobacterales bacterium CG18_big_fil_WC_8_21_14_2_50_71_9]|nr:WecB/TagA/CpsF family glycosyltransferase [Alphaproteobacteria bacterium]PIP97340.1 MAG: glycosyltransferase [Rhodobacterales bacterium CG18_big_fil_WC_8_21_14_2_50_71_9]
MPAVEADVKSDVLGVRIDALTMAQTVDRVCAAMRDGRRLRHCAINAAKLVKLRQDADLRDDVTSSDMLSADGMAVVWAARLLGQPLPERVAGVDLMDATLAACAAQGFRPYILGAKADVLARAAAALTARHPGLAFAGLRDGYFAEAEEPQIVAAINASRADCLFVAMPTPRKERFLARNAAVLAPPFLMGVGGSVDVFAGHVRRAPRWMQQAGLEWLHRLAQEPRRMFRRYATTNALFAGLLARALLRRLAGRAPLPPLTGAPRP